MEHTILFSADITPLAANNFINILTQLGQNGCTKLTIGINSSGGNVVAGVLLYNALMAMPYPVATHNLSNVDSIANVIFMAGKERKACAGATFMFHGVSFAGQPGEVLDEPRLREKLDVVTADHKRLAQIIAKHTSLTAKQCMLLFKQQGTRGTQWALDKGVIHIVEAFAYPANGNFYTFFG